MALMASKAVFRPSPTSLLGGLGNLLMSLYDCSVSCKALLKDVVGGDMCW